MSTIDDALFNDIFVSEGASVLLWEVGTRCDCWAEDSRQPAWGHEPCGGLGILYTEPVQVRGLFRAQSRWANARRQGEIDHGEASLTTPLAVKPGYTDRRVRDRFTVVAAAGDAETGRVFYPAAPPVPYLFGNVHRAWRVQLQSMNQDDRVTPQP